MQTQADFFREKRCALKTPRSSFHEYGFPNIFGDSKRTDGGTALLLYMKYDFRDFYRRDLSVLSKSFENGENSSLFLRKRDWTFYR